MLPEPENPFETMFGIEKDAEKEVQLLIGLHTLLPELTSPLQRAVQLERVMREPVALMMPFWIEIK